MPIATNYPIQAQAAEEQQREFIRLLEADGWKEETPGMWVKRDPATSEIIGIVQD